MTEINYIPPDSIEYTPKMEVVIKKTNKNGTTVQGTWEMTIEDLDGLHPESIQTSIYEQFKAVLAYDFTWYGPEGKKVTQDELIQENVSKQEKEEDEA